MERRKQRDQRSELPPPTCSAAQLVRVLSPRASESRWVADSSPLRHSLTEKFCADRASDRYRSWAQSDLCCWSVPYCAKQLRNATEPSPQLKRWRYSSALPSGASLRRDLRRARSGADQKSWADQKTWLHFVGDSQALAAFRAAALLLGSNGRLIERGFGATRSLLVFEDDALRISRQERTSLCVRRPHLRLNDFCGACTATQRPDYLFVVGGLWDVQDRSPDECARVLPAFADGLMSLMGHATKLVWLGALPRRHGTTRTLRNNALLAAFNNAAACAVANLDASALPPIFIRSFEVLDAVRDLSTDGRHYPPYVMIDLVLVALTAATGRPAVGAAPQPRRWALRLGGGDVGSASVAPPAAGDDRPRLTLRAAAGSPARSGDLVYALCRAADERQAPAWRDVGGGAWELSVRCSAVREYECTLWRELKAADVNRTVPRQLWRTPKEAQLGALEQRYVDIGRAYWAAAPPELHDKIAVARIGCTPT